MQLIKRLQVLSKQQPPRIQGIYNVLGSFVKFLYQDHDEIIINEFTAPQPFKKKNPKSIKTYFGFVRSYLIKCHGIRVTVDDVKAYITFPRIRKVPRKPITLKILKKIIEHSDAKHRALFLTLISSGMRIGESLALRKMDIFENERPVRIHIRAEITKTKEERSTFISSEAFEKIKPILDTKNDSDLIFTDETDPKKH